MAGTRRGFFSLVAMSGSLLLGYGSFATYVLRFIYPPQRRHSLRKVFVCRADELPVGQSRIVSDLRHGQILLAHTRRGWRALSTVCTHLGCRVHFVAERSIFYCPCHAGVFDAEGGVVSGPPPRPLPSYEVEERGGMLYVSLPEA